MEKKQTGFAVGTFLLVAAFVWIVFDSFALGLIFGLIAGAMSGAATKEKASDGQ